MMKQEMTQTAEPVKKTRCHMVIKDVVLKAPNGEDFSLHYRALGKKRDHFSGFLRKELAGWNRNCAISIPIVYGKEAFQDVVDNILNNADKFNAGNTIGRPRYFDILKDGVENLKETNLVADLKANHPDFHTPKCSCRNWFYRTIAGNFNMRSIKINAVHFKNQVAFKALMEHIKDQEIHKLVENLNKKTFEFEKEFIDFSNKFIEATHETFVAAYNDYMGNLIGTVTHRPVKLKNGGMREHWTIYVPEVDRHNAASVQAYNEAYNKCKSQLPSGLYWKRDVRVTTCCFMETKEVADAAAKMRREEMVRQLNAALEAAKKARKSKTEKKESV